MKCGGCGAHLGSQECTCGPHDEELEDLESRVADLETAFKDLQSYLDKQILLILKRIDEKIV